MFQRDFLQYAHAQLAIDSPTLDPRKVELKVAREGDEEMNTEQEAEILILGGGLGGVAAARAAARLGHRTILASAHRWLGGQLTTQGVPPDEHPWIEMFGATESYRTLRRSVREYYRRHYPLTDRARGDPYLNPGNAWVSRLAHEPHVAARVIDSLLAPYEVSGDLVVLREYRPTQVSVDRDRAHAVTLLGPGGHVATVEADYVLDATELGEVLELGGIEHVVGAESRAETGEAHAAERADPLNQQGFTWVFAVEHRPGEAHTISQPATYDFWRTYRAPFWPAPHLGWVYPHPETLKPVRAVLDFDDPAQAYTGRFGPIPVPPDDGVNFWTYRRILDAKNFEHGVRDICTVNWPQNDYWLRPLVGAGADVQREALAEGKQLSLCLLYWLQTEAPRADGDTGFAGLRLHRETFGTPDGMAPEPYIRESRRIRTEFTVKEQHLSVEARGERGAVKFADSVGIGAYRIDLHPSSGGDSYIDLDVWPFQIPLGALIPVRVENLLPAAKNIGTTHVTNGCYRLHPVEWSIGEAAALLAAFCLRRGVSPRAVRNTPALLEDFQRLIVAEGVELDWPEIRPL